MIHFFRRRAPHPVKMIAPPLAANTILERSVSGLIADRDYHLAELNRLTEIMSDTKAALDQHTRLYEALNETIFTLNHPFDEMEQIEFTDEDLQIDRDASVDHMSADEYPVIPLRRDKTAIA